MTTTAIHPSDEQFKAYLLKILVEDAVFAVQVRAILHLRRRKQKFAPLASVGMPVAEMPYWKLQPSFKPRNPKPYAIKKQTVLQLQAAWRDMPSAEELIKQLEQNK
jgi:hypothetical protein